MTTSSLAEAEEAAHARYAATGLDEDRREWLRILDAWLRATPSSPAHILEETHEHLSRS